MAEENGCQKSETKEKEAQSAGKATLEWFKSWKEWFLQIKLYDVAVAAIACSLYMPDQVTSVGSKHLTVSLGIPASTTAMYFTKLYASKTMSNFVGSLFMLTIQMLIPSHIEFLSVALTAMLLAMRIIAMGIYYSPKAAVYYYYAIVAQALFQGMFQSTFYPMAADKMSVLSLSFKVPKLLLWALQVFMDVVIPGKATIMISVHLVLMTTVSTVGCVCWILHFVFLKKDANKGTEGGGESVVVTTTPSVPATTRLCTTEDVNKGTETTVNSARSTGSQSRFRRIFMRLLGYRIHQRTYRRRCAHGCCDLDDDDEAESDFSMLKIMRLTYSPFFMCLLGWPFRTFFQPGILPYTLVERNLCHPIIISVMFFSFIVTFIVHMMKTKSRTMSKPWGPPPGGWHLLWLCMIPPILCVPFIYHALHNPQGSIYKGLKDNRVNVTIIALVMNSFTTVVDNSGYIGVSACSKNKDNKHGANAIRVISINAFAAQFAASFSYRLSSGYLILRKKYVDDIANTAPTDEMSWLARFIFWIGETMRYAWNDFVYEFHGNITDFV